MAHLKKVYGRSAMAEAMQEAINSTVSDTLTERSERAATQPKVDLPEDQTVINQVLDGEADLAFDVSYEVLPPVKLMDFKGIAYDKPVVEVDRGRHRQGSEPRVPRRTAATRTRATRASSSRATGSASRSRARSTARLLPAARPTTRT